jgi:type I restriction enzyme, S subunit
MSLLETDLADKECVRVGDCYEVTKKPRELDCFAVSEVPFAAMDAIPQDGTYSATFTAKAPGAIASGTYFQRGDLLVAKITPSFENGKQALALDLSAPFGYATTEVIPLHPREARHDPRLLFFYLLHPDIRHHIAERMEGTTGRQRVPENVLLDLPMPAFDVDEQRGIADALEVVRRASAAESECERAAHELKRAVMRELFTRGLRGETQKETEFGPVPESWELTPFEQVFKLTSGKTRPSDLTNSQTDQVAFPVLGGNGVMGFSGDWLVDAPRTLIIGRVGEYCGAIHTASGKIWITDNALYAKEWLKPDADLGFVAAFLEYFDLNRFKRMAGQPLVTQGMINEHKIPLPQMLDEQLEITAIFDAIERKIDLHRQKRAVLDELFKALLHKLMTGEVQAADLNLPALDTLPPVMPGLVSGIHEDDDVDGQVAPGHDGKGSTATPQAEAAQ